MGKKRVYYRSEKLDLTVFNNEPVLWITNSSQTELKGMVFVGGYPDEYCIYIKNMPAEERAWITDFWGRKIDIDKEISVLR